MSVSRKSADQWFAEYGESHQDRLNKTVHWICVPVIFYTVLGLIFSIPVPASILGAVPWFHWVHPAAIVVLLFYLRLSPPLAMGMLGFMSFCYLLLELQDLCCPVPVWKTSAVLFVVAWIGQFIGHHAEGRKPSFFKDLQFLLIGPAWLLHFIYRRFDVRY